MKVNWNGKRAIQDALKRAGVGPVKSTITSENDNLEMSRRLQSARVINPKPLDRTPPSPPKILELPTPNWFKQEKDVKISVIVPIYRSRQVLPILIDSWKFDIPHEVIFISDACPQQSHQIIIHSFEEKVPLNSVGKIIVLSHQMGFAGVCNEGVKHSKGEILVFLNADTKVTDNWLGNLIKPLENDNIGIVGNLQLKNDGTIDSAGSEWVKDSKNFEHIGRNIWKGQRLARRFTLTDAPQEMIASGEREMVTGCCIAIKRDLFNKIGGWDEGYRIGYWEDSDLCMKVKEQGKKIWFAGDSIIYHSGGHSGSGGHAFMMDNVKRFYSKWLYSDENGKEHLRF